MKRPVLIIFFLLMTLMADVASLVAAPASVSEQLPFYKELFSREINALHQDREGYIWLSTADGVARFDGYRTHTFRADYHSPERLADNRITCLADNRKFILIGTKRGLNLLDKQTWQLTRAQDSLLRHTEIRAMKQDRKGRLWIAIRGHLLISNAETDSLRECHFAHPINQIYEDRQGGIWLTTWNKGLYRWQEDTERFEKYPTVGEHDNPFCILEDKYGRYWIGSWDDGLFRFDPEKRSYTPLPFDEKRIYDIKETDSELFLLTARKAYRMQHHADGTLTPQPFPTDFDERRMFSNILVDRRGDLWFGAFDTGYHLYAPEGDVRSYPLSLISEQLSLDVNIRNLLFADGLLWMNQERYGYLHFNPTTKEVILPSHPFETDHIEPGIWVTERDRPTAYRMKHSPNGLQVTDSFTLAIPASAAQPSAKVGTILHLHEDTGGDLWIPTTRHLFLKENGKTPRLYGLTDVCCVTDDGEGNVVLGQPNGHIATANRAGIVRTRQIELTQGDELLYMAKGNGDTLWIATRLGRILCHRLHLGETTDHTRQSIGHSSLIINLLAKDDHVWIVTLSEIICYDHRRETAHRYAAGTKGICVDAFRCEAACLLPDGTLYAGGSGGIVAISPTSPSAPATCDTIVLSDLLFNGVSVFVSDSLSLCRNGEGDLMIPADAERAECTVTAFNYHSQERLRFCYRLDDKHWQALDAGENRISLGFLLAGPHTLQIAEATVEGTPVGKTFSYTLVKRPRWFETWGFQLALLLAVITAVILFFYWYHRHLYRRTAQVLTRIHTDEDDLFLQRIATYVQNHLADTVNLDRLAEETNVSKSTLARRIKSLTGLTPMDHVKHIRFHYACGLLDRGDMNISEVAYAVGFTNPKYFAKCFKDEFGLTPSQYQQKKR